MPIPSLGRSDSTYSDHSRVTWLTPNQEPRSPEGAPFGRSKRRVSPHSRRPKWTGSLQPRVPFRLCSVPVQPRFQQYLACSPLRASASPRR